MLCQPRQLVACVFPLFPKLQCLRVLNCVFATSQNPKTMATTSAPPLDELSRQAIIIRNRELTPFQELFPRIVKELTDSSPKSTAHINHSLFSEGPAGEICHAHRWLDEMMQYNVPHGKLIRGLSVTINYQILKYGYEAIKNGVELVGNGDVTEARVLGWCLEMFQAYFLVLDDIMDNSITRRGQPCWYKKENVGLIALNDSTLIQASIFYLMHSHLRDHPSYGSLVHLMQEGFRITGYGQSLDMQTEAESAEAGNGLHSDSRNLSVYRIERYRSIVQYKTSFYTFVLSTRLALYLANRTDSTEHHQVELIMLKIGELFQVQDDYLDCFADPTVIGKIGTDIRDGKCSWLVVKALELADSAQRELLKKNYGQQDDECEAKVKQLYRDIDLEYVYRKYETETLNEIIEAIEQLKKVVSGFPVEIFYEPLSHVIGREK